MKNKLTLPLLALGLGLLVTLAYARKPTPATIRQDSQVERTIEPRVTYQTPVPSLSASQIEALQSKTRQWLLYRNESVSVSFRHPTDYDVSDVSAWLPDRQQISEESPANADQNSQPQQIATINIYPKSEASSGDITLEVYTNPDNRPIDQWLDQAFPNIRAESEVRPITLAGVELLQWSTTEEAQFIDTLLPQGNKVFWVRLHLQDRRPSKRIEETYQTLMETLLIGN